MKHLLHRISLGIILCTGALAAADEAAPRRLGDAAFYAGDYRNAISSYESALEIAERAGNQEEWAASALNLAVAYLHNGEIGKARRILQIFRRKFPLRGTGTLEGDLLFAEGKIAEAEKFYREMKTADPVAEDARLFSLATLYMTKGGEKNLTEAADIFLLISGVLPLKQQMRSVEGVESLFASGNSKEAYRKLGETLIRPDSPWRKYAALEAAYVLIRLQRLDEATAILAKVPANERNVNVELLDHLAAAYSGKIAGLKKNYPAFLEKLPPMENLRVIDLFWNASQVALREKDFAFADQLLNDVKLFTKDKTLQQSLAHQQIEIQLQYDPAKTVKTLLDYVKRFPDDPQKYKILYNTAGKLYTAGFCDRAVEVLEFLTTVKHEREMVLEIAVLGIYAAEKSKNFAALEKFNRLFSAHAEVEKRIGYQQRYAAFLESSGKFNEAEKELKEAFTAAKAGKNSLLTDTTGMALLGFYLRRDNPVGILETASLLENSADPAIAAEAKCVLGDLQYRSYNSLRAREYYLAAAKLPVNRHTARAKFHGALMAYKETDFATAAKEFLECAETFPNYWKTPEALLTVIDIADPETSADEARRAEKLLREKYADTPAFAVFILQQAGKMGLLKENIPALLTDLELVEKNFAGADFSAEAALLRAVFLDRLGKYQESLAILASLHHHKNPQIAAESLIRSGEIFFRQGKLAEAQKLFLQSAVTDPGSLSADIAMLRAVDCDLAAKNPLAQPGFDSTIDRLNTLIRSSKFQRIRLEAYCKKGIALEHTGNKKEALAAYEQAVYAAVDMVNQGLIPDRIWCIKSCESALLLIAESDKPGALQRGLQLIERSRQVFDDELTITRMRDNFRKQMNKKRR